MWKLTASTVETPLFGAPRGEDTCFPRSGSMRTGKRTERSKSLTAVSADRITAFLVPCSERLPTTMIHMGGSSLTKSGL